MNAEKNNLMPTDSPKESLTPEILRAFKGLENVSDEEADEITLSLRAFAALVFDYCKLKEKNPSSEIIDINQNNNQKQAA